MTGGMVEALWQCWAVWCKYLVTPWRWRSPVSWLLLCKVACYRNKVKARGKNVGWSQLRGLQSTVTPAGRFTAFKTIKSLAKILLVCKHQQPGDKDDTNQSKYFTVYDDGGTLGFLVTDNNIQPQLVAGAVLRLALGKWGVHVHTPLLYRTSLAHSLLTGYDTTYMLIYSFHSVCLWFSATLCSQDATSGDTSPLYRVTITVPIRPIMNWGWHGYTRLH